MLHQWLLPAALLVAGLAAPGVANAADEPKGPKEPKPAEKMPDNYVRVTIEVKGTLAVEKGAVRVRVLMLASCLFVQYEVWDLDFGTDADLRAAATKLNGKTVIVTGEPTNRQWGFIEPSMPLPAGGFAGAPKEPQPQPRQFVRVKSLKAADAK